jgi:Family of unknown function (DUF6065)
VIDLKCYLTDDDHPVDIRPARNRREWMNETPSSYAYRCLPLSIANAHGWEVRCPLTFEAEWNGSSGQDDIQVTFEDDENTYIGSKKITKLVESHFGSGVLTFNVGVVLGTPPGYDLWVSGPVNEFKDGIQALSAVVETYWMPFTFTMNWKFTRPHLRVRFEKGKPYCFFFPIEHGLLERVNPSLEQLSEFPDLERQYKLAFYKREAPLTLKKLKGEGFKIREKERFEGWYIKGELPDGTEIPDHKRRVQVKPFEMRRESLRQ